MEKVILTRVATKNTDKDGNPLKDKNGKPYWRVGIQTDKYGDQWLSTLAFNTEDRAYKLEQGQEVNIVVEKKGEFMNFKLPTKLDILEQRVAILEDWVRKQQPQGGQPTGGVEYPTEDINPEDVPF